MWRISYAIKSTIAHAFFWLGLFELWRTVTLRNKAVVLMYHRVLTRSEQERSGSNPGYVVRETTFDRHLEYLSKRFTVLTESQFAEHLDHGRPFPNSACLITFDDGWVDNLTNALPVLQRHRMPAVIYLPVNFIGHRRLFTREALTHVLVHAVRLAQRGDAKVAGVREALARYGLTHVLNIRSANPFPEVIVAVAEYHWHNGNSEQVIEELEKTMGVAVEDLGSADSFVSWEQVREMAASGITFGGHGVEHRLLGEIAPAEADREIRDSMSAISSHIGRPVSFSYPNGSLTPEVRAMVAESGYRFAVTTEAGLVASNDDRFTIKRINVHEDMTRSTPMFLARVLGLF